MAKGAISFNAASFLGGFKRFCNVKMPMAVEKAQFQTGWMVIRYANTKKPYTPTDKKDLRGSGRVEVVPARLEVIDGCNKEYDANWHEITPAK